MYINNLHATVLNIENKYIYFQLSSHLINALCSTKLNLVDITGKKHVAIFEGCLPVNLGDEIQISYRGNREEEIVQLVSLFNITQERIIADFVKQR